jgi:glutathione synthase/RimK-type ligase-like ATP-grasp enzyme
MAAAPTQAARALGSGIAALLGMNDEAKFRELVAARDVLVQGFVPEIAEGEVSLVFLGGRFSHAVRKTPRKGDFRVQSDYGGIHELIDADPAWVREAERVLLLAIASPLVYARVDVVVTPAGLVWMELEATDPELFFRLEPRAAETFADAIVAAIEPRTHRRPT